MTIKDLKAIYDKEHSQSGDTDKDFYEWAINYLLIKTDNNKVLIIQLKRHLKGIEKAVEQLEKE